MSQRLVRKTENSFTPQMVKYSVIDQIGSTPLIHLANVLNEESSVDIYGKAEWFNPGGSVKDRPALNMILDGERSGKLTKDKILLDATSGNTGVAYAMLGAVLGYRVRLVIPENTSSFIKHMLRAYNADVVLSDPQAGSDGAIKEAIRLYEQNPDLYFYPDQYNNPVNWLAHYNGTGKEIYHQTNGKITHFVAGLGTSGTFTGTGRRLKDFNDDIQLVAVHPDAPLHGLEGLKHMETAIVPGIYDPNLADEHMEIETEAAQDMVKRLAREEGLFVGTSSGAAVAAALKVAERLTEGVIVTILPDSGYRYKNERYWES